MSDFDDRARAAGSRIRRRADELSGSSGAKPTAVIDIAADEAGNGPRWWTVAAACILAVGGVVAVGLVVTSSDDSDPASDLDTSSATPSVATTAATTPETTVPTSSTEADAATANPATSVVPTTPPTSTTVETTAPPTTVPAVAELVRPVFDPEVCDSITASESEPSTVHDLTLFARPSELPVPIQVIGDPVDGEAKPFALVQRHYDRDDSAYPSDETVDVNQWTVRVSTYPNGNGQATWLLADGSQGYLRSRGLDGEQIAAIVAGLTPRPVDVAVNGFDYAPDPPIEGLELVAEQMNTTVEFGAGAGSQCEVPAAESVDVPGTYGYGLTVFTGDPVARFGAVIDRPVPVDVGVVGDQVVIVHGVVQDFAPTVGDIVETDPDTWLELRSRPTFEEEQGFPRSIGGGLEVVTRLEPVMSGGEVSYLTLQMEITDGVPFLEVSTADASVDATAERWEILVDGNVRHQSTAGAGTLIGVRLAETPLTDDFTVTVRTVDTDGHLIQSTDEINLHPANNAVG